MADSTASSETSQDKGVQETRATLISLGYPQDTCNDPLHFLWVTASVRREVTDESPETYFLPWSLHALCSTSVVCGLHQAQTWLNLGETTLGTACTGWMAELLRPPQTSQFSPAPTERSSPAAHPLCPSHWGARGLNLTPYSLSLSLAQLSFLSSRFL